jgi:anti-sigma B factor antagonist
VTVTSLSSPTSDLVSISVSTGDSAVVLSAAGEIDSSSAPVLRARLESALDGDVVEVTVDLDRVTFLDSAGLCVLAAAHRRAAERSVRLRVRASGRAVIRPLQITGLYDLLSVEQGEPAAGIG